MQFWNNFAAKHPAAAKWVREGGLFVIVSNLIILVFYLFSYLFVLDLPVQGNPVQVNAFAVK